MAQIENFEVFIASDTAEGQAVQERIVKRLEELEFPPRDVFGVRLALEEAIVNAIKHGNGMDLSKTVRIAWTITDDRIRVVIEDQGKGFKPADVPDPTCDENLEKPCGRGIMLMRAFLNVCQYNKRGNQVTLEKIRGVAPDSVSDDD